MLQHQIKNTFFSMKILSLLMIFLLFVAACSSPSEPREIELKPYTLFDLAKQDFENVTKIKIQSGETGEEKIVEDQEVIENFMKNMETAYFTPDINQKKREGWSYWIVFYEENKAVFDFYPNYIDDIYFVADENVMANIEKLFSS